MTTRSPIKFLRLPQFPYSQSQDDARNTVAPTIPSAAADRADGLGTGHQTRSSSQPGRLRTNPGRLRGLAPEPRTAVPSRQSRCHAAAAGRAGRKKGGPTRTCTCGHGGRHKGAGTREVLTALGPIGLTRTYFHCPDCRLGGYWADERLGVEGRLSPRAEQMITLAGVTQSFRHGCSLLDVLAGWTTCPEI